MLCRDGKRQYKTHDAAEDAVSDYTKQWGEDDPLMENLNIYYCRYCSNYHLGHRGGRTPEQNLILEIRKINNM